MHTLSVSCITLALALRHRHWRARWARAHTCVHTRALSLPPFMQTCKHSSHTTVFCLSPSVAEEQPVPAMCLRRRPHEFKSLKAAFDFLSHAMLAVCITIAFVSDDAGGQNSSTDTGEKEGIQNKKEIHPQNGCSTVGGFAVQLQRTQSTPCQTTLEVTILPKCPSAFVSFDGHTGGTCRHHL